MVSCLSTGLKNPRSGVRLGQAGWKFSSRAVLHAGLELGKVTQESMPSIILFPLLKHSII
jgi:hypothetical protein